MDSGSADGGPGGRRLSRYQNADTWSGRVVSGASAIILGVPGLVFLAALIL
jgi:hypothetical protein